MPARFRLFDNPDGGADRYFIVDSRPLPDLQGDPYGPWRNAMSMNSMPYHPQMGIGLSTQLDARAWGHAITKRFRNWGKRIKLDDLPPDAAHCSIRFVQSCFDLDDRRYKKLGAFLAEVGRHQDIVGLAHQHPQVSRILRTLLKES